MLTAIRRLMQSRAMNTAGSCLLFAAWAAVILGAVFLARSIG